MTWLIIIGGFLVLLTLLNLKKSRSDGEYLYKVHPYRKVMLHIMPTRNESYVLYDDFVVADELLRYLDQVKGRFHCDMQHMVVAGVAHAIRKTPSMNRFVVGRRLYQRKGVWVTFSMKREKLNRAAKLTAVKREVTENESIKDLCDALNASIKVERSDAVTYTDKEVGLFAKIPRPVMVGAVKIFKLLDYYNLLPASFIKNDGFYTSIFVANLGSLGMKAGYHHLYEWGTSPLFLMVGRMEERVFVEDGQLVTKKVIPLRFTYDERIDDGLNAGHGIKGVVDALENPFHVFGCTAADGSDDHPIGKMPEAKQKDLEQRLDKQHLVVTKAA